MVRVLIAGDIWLSPTLKNRKRRLSNVLNQIAGPNKVDIFVANLEAPVKGNMARQGRRAILATEASLLPLLRIADNNILTLANNHILDYKNDGLQNTIDICSEKGFKLAGAGANLEEAVTPEVLEVNGRKIAIFAFSDTSEEVGAISATAHSPGVAPLEAQMMADLLRKAAGYVDDVWVFFHWGKEFIRYPRPQQRDLAKLAVDSGATLIVGHHPHVVVGAEQIRKAWVYYSLGNFVFPNVPLIDGSILAWSKVSRFSLALSLVLRGERWHVEPIFVNLQNDGIPDLVPLRKLSKAAKYFKRLCHALANQSYAQKYIYYFFWDYICHRGYQLLDMRKLPMDIIWSINRLIRDYKNRTH